MHLDTPEIKEEASLATTRTMELAPQVVLDEAAHAARALSAVIAQKPRKVLMNGEQYLEFEDWQTVGRFYGITAAAVGEPEFVTMGDAAGFKATSVALDASGRELSRATAYCLNDEEKWSSRPKYEWAYVLKSGGHSVEDPGADELVWEPNPNKPGKNRPRKERIQTGLERVPLFQLASMAQTRANAKALRNVLSWVVVLAGYRPTPAEELDAQVVETVATDVQQEAPAPSPGPATTNGGARAERKPQAASDELPVSKDKPSCPTCKSDRSVLCTSKGLWGCSRAKGGCGRELARASGGAR